MNVPYPYASYLILRALMETNGTATAAEDNEIVSSMKTLFRQGLYACPEAAATLAALEKLENQHAFDPDETILLYLTGNATKYFNALEMRREQIPVLERNTSSLD